MAATILAFPETRKPTVIPFDEALDIIGSNAEEWRSRIAELMDQGGYLEADEGRAFYAFDADALTTLGGVLASMSHHLHRMAEMHRSPDSAG